jgi:allophanate hydrolase
MRAPSQMPGRPLDIRGLRAAYADGLDPALVVDQVFDAIDAAGDPGIFISLVERKAARRAARKLGTYDPAKPLWGVPFAVKDNIDTAGLPTTAACPAFAYTPKANAASVQRALDAGALLIGKTNLDQFATGLVGVRTPYPVPRNAFDPAIGGCGGAGPGAVRARHRHGRLGPGARGPQQCRRPQTLVGRGIEPRHRAGVCDARLCLGVCGHRR